MTATPQSAGSGRPLNIADRLRESTEEYPWQRAVVFPSGRDRAGRVLYSQLTFEQLNDDSDELARGLLDLGVEPGQRLVLMVRPSLEFISLTFAIFKTGAVCVLIDPGMGRTNIFNCLEEIDPAGFVAIPLVHAIRRLNRRRFRNARLNVTTGRRMLRDVVTCEELRARADSTRSLPQTTAGDAAAIIFTSGSTGPPKGVVYEHGMFNAQVDLLRDFYAIQPGEIDLPGFPLFALFNSAMGVTTVIPDMDPTKPARVNPERILEAIRDQGVTQAFGSPALWNQVGRHVEAHKLGLPSVRRVLSAGAPVPDHVLRRITAALPSHADIFTPYGATECLPVASIGGREVLEHTAAQTATGAGTCVGWPFPGVEIRVVRITDGPIATMDEAELLEAGEIGEIVVRSPSATREYFRREEATALAKIRDGDTFWHRMGDVGYHDTEGRLWFCGRKAHIVTTDSGPLYPVRCEAIFNQHAAIYRSALVGVGEPGRQTPVVIVEPEAHQFPTDDATRRRIRDELLHLGKANPLTETIETLLFHRSLPVDIRHNVKIFREKLVPWAAAEIERGRHR